MFDVMTVERRRGRSDARTAVNQNHERRDGADQETDDADRYHVVVTNTRLADRRVTTQPSTSVAVRYNSRTNSCSY